MDRIVTILRDLVGIPSPSGFTGEVIGHIERLMKQHGVKTRRSNKGALTACSHPKPDLIVSGHIDTLGAMVSGVNTDGTLAFTNIGGPVLPSFEGEYVTVFGAGGKTFRGTLLLNNPAAHVNKDAKTVERKIENMHIRLDAETAKRAQTAKLGVRTGDFICYDPRFEYTPTGFVKSRFMDDKAGSACMIDAILSLGKTGMEKHPVAFFFSNYEEVGHGAAAGLPATATRMLVVDMGVVGDKVEGREGCVSICVKDSTGPYDYELRCRLAGLAKRDAIPHQLDVFPFYGSDGSAALAAGHDLRVGLIGPGVSASHGMERTHLKGLQATRDLILAYIKDT